jgi:hypothetical protein
MQYLLLDNLRIIFETRFYSNIEGRYWGLSPSGSKRHAVTSVSEANSKKKTSAMLSKTEGGIVFPYALHRE